MCLLWVRGRRVVDERELLSELLQCTTHAPLTTCSVSLSLSLSLSLSSHYRYHSLMKAVEGLWLYSVGHIVLFSSVCDLWVVSFLIKYIHSFIHVVVA